MFKRKRKPKLNWRPGLPVAGLLILFVAMRAPALGRFVTTDEALWLRRSANFYLAVSSGDWQATFQSPHPGVITQWAGAAGFWLRFPQYAQVGSVEIHDVQLLQLMENRGVNPMEILATGRAVLLVIHAAAFLALWPFARQLLGQRAALLSMALLALDTFTIAHQRLLHLDGLLASFMLLSFVAYLSYAQTNSRFSLIASGIAAGLAWLTKTPALFLIPAIFAVSALQVWRAGTAWRTTLARSWRAPLLWLGIAALTMLLLFPALWLAPLDIPAQMIGYALGSAEGEYSGPVFFNGVVYPDGNLGSAGLYFYIVNFLWRATPLVIAGIAIALLQVVARSKRATPSARRAIVAKYLASARARFASRRARDPQPEHFALLALLAFSLGFVVLMTIAEKKFDRYLLPALPALILVSGWGWQQLPALVPKRRRGLQPMTLLVAVALLQGLSALNTAPYYLSYYNPLLGGPAAAPAVMQVGWGEGLDQAAAYLNQQTSVDDGDAAAWYSVSFNLMLSSTADDIPISLELSQSQLDALLAKDYLVIYVHQWQRGTPQNLLDALASIEPEHRVWINGLEYARVYHLND